VIGHALSFPVLKLSSKIGSGVVVEVQGSCQSSYTVPALFPASQSHASHRIRRQGSGKAVNNRTETEPRTDLSSSLVEVSTTTFEGALLSCDTLL
jgi:hypothetical protein